MNSYADSWLTINGRPWLRFRGRNTVEFILLCISAAAIPITLLTIVIIIRTTPEKLKRYQWILLNLTITIFLADVTICFLFDPITLFPEIACYSESWFANISEDANYILFCISILLLQFSFCATLIAFIHRLKTLQPLPPKLEYLLLQNTHYITAIIYLMGNIPVIAVLATSYRTKEEMQAIIERKPHLQFLKSYGSYLAAEKEDYRFNEFQAVWLASALLLIPLCGIVAAIIAVHLHKKRHLMSSKTMQLHRYLMFHLITQVLAPALSVLVPIMILFSTRYFQVPFGAMFWNSVISQVVALHSPVNTITILFATRHYRAALFKPFKCIFNIAYGRKIASTVSSRRMNLTRAWQSNAGRFRSNSSN